MNHHQARPKRVQKAVRRRDANQGLKGGSVVAMANPRRTQRVSQQIMREVSLLMLSDKRVRCAWTREAASSASALSARPRRATMSPEERLGADANLSVVASVTEVVISGDLQVAKVFVSFFGAHRRLAAEKTGSLRGAWPPAHLALPAQVRHEARRQPSRGCRSWRGTCGRRWARRCRCAPCRSSDS